MEAALILIFLGIYSMAIATAWRMGEIKEELQKIRKVMEDKHD